MKRRNSYLGGKPDLRNDDRSCAYRRSYVELEYVYINHPNLNLGKEKKRRLSDQSLQVLRIGLESELKT